ncbi:MAG: GNAT family N-acetyltransferase [Saprospiraceae bacterium]|nr:GNAT family N-acetyltransferase [Saprospiraceae bacterium]
MENTFFCCQIDFATSEAAEALIIRNEILRKPLQLSYNPEDIEHEWDSVHLGVFLSDHTMIGTLILKPLTQDVIKMRQVAISSEWQGRGIGKLLVSYSEDFAAKLGFSSIELHARMSAVPFYTSLEYQIKGDVFSEVGIEHLKMFKYLNSTSES